MDGIRLEELFNTLTLKYSEYIRAESKLDKEPNGFIDKVILDSHNDALKELQKVTSEFNHFIARYKKN